MMQSLSHWRVVEDATYDEVYAILARDPIWNCFALADLEPPLRAYSQFPIAFHTERDEQAICLILRHPIIGQVLSPFGSDEGIAALLSSIELPERPLLQVQEMHVPALLRFYQPEKPLGKLLRMALTTPAAPNVSPPQPVSQLTHEDVGALQMLYERQTEVVFSAELFSAGLFFGAYKDGQIIAAGGTHVLAPQHRLAVLGYILTAPEARRQGYATAITSALVNTLLQQGYATIILNVFEENEPACRVYQRLGFQTCSRFMTGRAVLAAAGR